MVQTISNLELALGGLAGSGIVVSRETKAALPHSLLLKEAQSGLHGLSCWGRFLTTSGKDYLVARAIVEYYALEDTAVATSKFFFSQDAVQWLDLADVPETITEQCRSITSMLSGDPSHVCNFPTEPKPATGGSARKPSRKPVTELQRLRAMIADIDAAVAIVPSGSRVVDAEGHVISNRLFPGLAFPEKLESYQHLQAAPDTKSPTLADDVRGLWSLHWDSFTGVAVLRSLLFPGYAFFYDGRSLHWGGLYLGTGFKNNDLIFAL